jgi:hypothetical protein
MRFWIWASLLAGAIPLLADDESTPTFHSDVSVGRSDALVRRRHPDATLQYPQIGLATDSGRPGLISRVAAHPPTGDDTTSAQTDSANTDSPATPHRRLGVSDLSGTQVNLPVQAPVSADAATPQPTVNHRRGVSDPGSGPMINSGPSR